MSGKNGNNKNGRHRPSLHRTSETPKISKLGQRLREISDMALASGTNVLSADEIHNRLAEIRGGRCPNTRDKT